MQKKVVFSNKVRIIIGKEDVLLIYYCKRIFEKQQIFWNMMLNFDLAYSRRIRSGDLNFSSTDIFPVTLPNLNTSLFESKSLNNWSI